MEKKTWKMGAWTSQAENIAREVKAGVNRDWGSAPALRLQDGDAITCLQKGEELHSAVQFPRPSHSSPWSILGVDGESPS